MPVAVPIPERLHIRYGRDRAGRAWLASLPELVAQAMDRWQLSLDPPGVDSWPGRGALVLPVRSVRGPAVLKVVFPHDDALAEPAALALWSGTGAVRLYNSDTDTGCLLLERLDHRRPLATVPLPKAVSVWGGLVRRLSLPAQQTPGWAALPSLAERTEQLSDELPADWEELGRPCRRRLLEAALEVCQTRGAVGRRSSNDVLVHADLHPGNILYRPQVPAGSGAGSGTGTDAGYVAVDPTALVGEAEFSVAPMLRAGTAGREPAAARRLVRDRLAGLCAAGGLDPETARQWSLLREVRGVLESARAGQREQAERSVRLAEALAA